MKTETHHEKPLGSSNSALSGALDRIACTFNLMSSNFLDVGHDRRFKSTVEDQAMHDQRLANLGYLE